MVHVLFYHTRDPQDSFLDGLNWSESPPNISTFLLAIHTRASDPGAFSSMIMAIRPSIKLGFLAMRKVSVSLLLLFPPYHTRLRRLTCSHVDRLHSNCWEVTGVAMSCPTEQ